MKEEHEQRHTLREARQLINCQTLQRESNLAQFRADETERIEAERIAFFQQDETLSQQYENKRIRRSQRFA